MKEPNLDVKVKEFFELIDIKPVSDLSWDALKKKISAFGNPGRKFLRYMDRRVAINEKDNAELNATKNASWGLADFICCRFDALRLMNSCQWVVSTNLKFDNKRILEVGCDSGIFLCFLAWMYPKARFVGIDSCKEAIKVAQARAKSLKLKNIEFQAIPLEELPAWNGKEKFDGAFTLLFWEDLLDYNEGYPKELFQILAKLIVRDGFFVTQDQILFAEAINLFVDQVEDARFKLKGEGIIDFEYSETEVISGGQIKMRLFEKLPRIYRRKATTEKETEGK